MQEATPVGTGAMAAFLGLDFGDVVAVAAEAAQGEVCEAANDNAPGQVVVSGHKGAVERAVAIARRCGAKHSVMLAVSAPFHCALMKPAANVMAEALRTTAVRQPSVPIVANVTARPLADPERDQTAIRGTGNRHGALARVDGADGRRWRSTFFVNWGAVRS